MPDAVGEVARPSPECPVEVALVAVSGRWTTLLLRDLMHGPRSHGQSRAALPTLSDKVLADRLVDLRERGLVGRHEQRGFPTRVAYALTPAGEALRPLLVELYRTGQQLQQQEAARAPACATTSSCASQSSPVASPTNVTSP